MKKTTILTTTLLLIALLFSCRGSQQNKLIGNWERIPFTKPVKEKKYWLFYAGDALDTYTLDSLGVKIDSATYTYSIDGKTFSIFGEGGYAPGAGDIRGTYWVEQLNDSYFKANKTEHPVDTSGNNWGDSVGTNPFLRIELAKR
jgi:hypothetical protein